MSTPEVFRKHVVEHAPITVDTSFLIHEPAEEYHAQAGAYLSSHQLGDFRRCPLLYHKKELGLIEGEDDRPAYVVGRAAHVLILEGREAYEARYAVGGPVNPKTGEPYGSRTKAFREWAESHERSVPLDAQAALIEDMSGSVNAHEEASALLAEGIADGVVRAEYRGLPCQARLDWLNPRRGIVDLKTCDNLDWLQTDARLYGYAHQLAFYRAVVAVATGDDLPVYLIAVEKREPFRCGVWSMGEDVLELARRENEEAISRLTVCRQLGQWPTGYEGIRVFDWI